MAEQDELAQAIEHEWARWTGEGPRPSDAQIAARVALDWQRAKAEERSSRRPLPPPNPLMAATVSGEPPVALDWQRAKAEESQKTFTFEDYDEEPMGEFPPVGDLRCDAS